MKMKVLLFSLMIFFAIASFASGQLAETSSLQVTLINQEPHPVEPGEHLVVRFRIENLGGEPAQDVVFEISPEFPFAIAPAESSTRNLGTIAARQKDKIGVTIKYDLIVDTKASDGNSELFARYRMGTQEAKAGPFNISIKLRQAIVGISSIEISPEQVSPGERVNISLSVRNDANSALKQVQIRMDLSSPDVPFAPLNSEAFSVPQLAPGEIYNFRISLVSLPDSKAGVYKIPLELSYSDELGRNYTKPDILSLVVGGKPSIDIIISEQDVLSPGATGEFTVQVINKGLIDVKLASIEVKESPGVELLSPRKVYLGELDSDDFDTSRFKIHVDSNAESVKIPVELSYMDANNNEYYETVELKPKVYSKSELSRLGLGGNGSFGIIAGTIIAIVIVLAFLRLRKKNNKE